MKPPARDGRGAASNPDSRFARLRYEADEDVDPGTDDDTRPGPPTQFFADHARTILAHNDSPDVGFDTSLNAYRGCEHGCVYCYARPTHEYLGYSAGLDFETKILVKEGAPELLRRELSAPKWVPHVIAMSGVTDCYQPAERKLRLTRRCLEVLAACLNPIGIITKNHGVTRDIDLLSTMAAHNTAAVYLSITTLDPALSRVMEPRASTPSRRLAAVRELSAAGIPVGVLVAPTIPGLTDHEMPAILAAAAEAGARFAGYVMLRLPHGVKDLFSEWLETHFPLRKAKILGRIEEVRGGRLNDPEFGSRMTGRGIYAEQTAAIFALTVHRLGLSTHGPKLSTAAFRRPWEAQLRLFE